MVSREISKISCVFPCLPIFSRFIETLISFVVDPLGIICKLAIDDYLSLIYVSDNVTLSQLFTRDRIKHLFILTCTKIIKVRYLRWKI